MNAVWRALTLAVPWARRLYLEAGPARVRAGEDRRSGADFGGIHVLAALRVASRVVRAAWRWLSWRRRRFVVRCKRVLIGALLVLMVAGVRWSYPLYSWVEGTVLMGGPPMWGQIVVRPPMGPGAVRRASVKLLPAGPGGWLTGVLIGLATVGPSVVEPVVDHAGRWRAADVVPGWRYAVVVGAEGCRPTLAGVVDIGWLRSARFDYWMRSCMDAEVESDPRFVLRSLRQRSAGVAGVGR